MPYSLASVVANRKPFWCGISEQHNRKSRLLVFHKLVLLFLLLTHPWSLTLPPDLSAQSGFEVNFKHLDGHMVKVKKQGITSPGDVMQLKKEGMPRRGSNGKTFGSLYIRFSIAFPKVRFFTSSAEAVYATIEKYYANEQSITRQRSVCQTSSAFLAPPSL